MVTALLAVLLLGCAAALVLTLRRTAQLRAALAARPPDPAAPVPDDERHHLAISAYYPIEPRPRYGHGQPYLPRLMAVLDAGVPEYRARLERFVPLLPELGAIRRDPDPAAPHAPAWINGFLPGLDSLALYGIIATERPPRYLEIGSGNSTRFVAQARRLHSPATRITSIDPHPRAEIDALCDTVIRQPLEAVDLGLLRSLAAGDVLFFDGSHRVLQNSDATVFFLEILPELAAGVWVQIHDIFWPSDYPPPWADRYYSEQYLAGLLLLLGEAHFEVVLPNAYIATCTDLGALFDPLWRAPDLAGIEPHGSSLWLRRR
jgi:hypothetical protein